MSSYGELAWTYNEAELGIDPETKLPFSPNKKELDLFKQEKTDMYKGTWMVCFVYGLSAIFLLFVIFFTDWGRIYIYNRFLPAVFTYVLGAIFIIIYLVISITSLKPRKLGKVTTAMPVCPDYWNLEPTTESERKDIVNNIQRCKDGEYDKCSASIGDANKQYILKNQDDPIINSEDSQYLKYKCVPDVDVFGSPSDIVSYKNEFEASAQQKFILASTKNNNKEKLHVYRELGSEGDNNDSIKKYAQISGNYKNDWNTSGTDADIGLTGSAGLYDNTILLKDNYGSGNTQQYDYKNNPLVCNKVYPGIIGALEDSKFTDNLRCEYADKCGISWSKLDCLTKT